MTSPAATRASRVSNALLRALREMRDTEARGEYEDSEIVRSGGECWLGARRISPAVLTEGLRLCLFYCDGLGTPYERYDLNEDGRALADDPERYVPMILRIGAPK